MDSELQDILDRGLHISEKYVGGEFRGVDWRWKDHLEDKLGDYFRRKFGFPTETLEAGVVVVPVEVVRRITQTLRWMDATGSRFHCIDAADVDVLKEALSRLQQNAKPPTESRITVTIDMQTWQGYRDRRVIEVEPGIGWPERMMPEVERAAHEMEERLLCGPTKQNGGEGR